MSTLKIAICQFGLRDTFSYDQMAAHLKEQCRLAAKTEPDIILFPELTTFGLLSMAGTNITYTDLPEVVPKILGAFTPIYEQIFKEEANRSGALIIGGSTWVQDQIGNGGHNTAYVFYPEGRMAKQKKNHLFPGETDWGTVPHDTLDVFEHAGIKFGIMTCYDSEFPEVGRHLMNSGAQLLFCPTNTYTKRGFYRVRRCCAARAVENQLYVVEGHIVGDINVPKDRPFTSFGRSAILSPIDDQIGIDDGIVVEAGDGETEMIVIGEIDLDALLRSRESSEATILKDRRPEIYNRSYQIF